MSAKKRLLALFVFLFCWSLVFPIQSYLFAGENEKPSRTRTNFYHTFDEWTDVPLVYYYAPLKSDEISPMEVTLWKDGRIAWKDWKKGYDSYFMSRIPEEKVDSLLKSIGKRYENSPLKQRPARHNTSSFHEMYAGVATINSSSIFSDEIWMHSMLAKSHSLGEWMKNESMPEVVHSIKKQLDEKQYSIYGEIFSNYRKAFGSKEKGSYSEKEIYWFTRQFADDGEFFVFLGKSLADIIPTDDGLISSVPKSHEMKDYIVKEYIENGKKIFVYETVLGETSPSDADVKAVSSDSPGSTRYIRP